MQRIKELDAIRGLAAIAIVVFQIGAPLGYSGNPFFVLSGYLITTIVLGNPMLSGFPPSFSARRALRSWPACYAGLSVVLLIDGLRHDVPGSLAPVAVEFVSARPGAALELGHVELGRG